ncbi:Membrane-associated tyrosine- and threonine-specific cdc2-inhibitory kinase [Pseudolycoriella hygida]|uniref:non-specific serine/threonine protein kinase n=1 Tax=Pseudolycoriella hygida TaxID=35572 RepID=A0A9Q0NC83_9DIPT|nr:Membrane-associated tyrosine- and threonine-specific cdc2-inhibitory kinase [Pseudolycoriella hygida]
MSLEKTYLPLPEFDLCLQHSFKQENSSRTRKPPKLNPNTSFSKLASTSYQVISFRNNASKNYQLNPQSTNQCIESYFDKCFVLIEKIGEGSFSEVFKVRSKEDGELYAIKKSLIPYRSEFYRERSLDEVRNFEIFSDNKNCVTFYKAWEQNGYLYMQLELCQTLESYIKRRTDIGEDFYWNVLLDILLALKALHDRNLIHMDVKLENILIDKDNVCKLSDFGLVVNSEQPKLQDTAEGDSRYIAPELLNYGITKAADIFSLGITMLELTTNLELQTNGPLWHELRKGVIPSVCVQRMSRTFEKIIRAMMSPSPNKRPNVDQLLQWPRIKKELRIRQKLTPFKYMKRCCRNTKNFLLHTARQFTHFLLRITGCYVLCSFLLSYLSLIFPKTEPPPPDSADKSTTGLFIDTSDTDSPLKNLSLSNRIADYSSTRARFVNSTPVIRHPNRSRSNMLSNSFNSSISSLNESSVIRKKLCFSKDSD